MIMQIRSHEALFSSAQSYRVLTVDLVPKNRREEEPTLRSLASQIDMFSSYPYVFYKYKLVHRKTSPPFETQVLPSFDLNVASVRMVAVAFGEKRLTGAGPPSQFSPGRLSPRKQNRGYQQDSLPGETRLFKIQRHSTSAWPYTCTSPRQGSSFPLTCFKQVQTLQDTNMDSRDYII